MGPVSDDITQQMVDDMKRVDAQHTSEELNNRALYTLNAFDQLARYLAGIPGRKNVIWFSSGFPLDVAPNLNEADPNDSVVRNDDAVRKTDNMLTRAQIAVYPVDVRGLMVPLVDLEKAAAAALAPRASAKRMPPFPPPRQRRRRGSQRHDFRWTRRRRST